MFIHTQAKHNIMYGGSNDDTTITLSWLSHCCCCCCHQTQPAWHMCQHAHAMAQQVGLLTRHCDSRTGRIGGRAWVRWAGVELVLVGGGWRMSRLHLPAVWTCMSQKQQSVEVPCLGRNAYHFGTCVPWDTEQVCFMGHDAKWVLCQKLHVPWRHRHDFLHGTQWEVLSMHMNLGWACKEPSLPGHVRKQKQSRGFITLSLFISRPFLAWLQQKVSIQGW